MEEVTLPVKRLGSSLPRPHSAIEPKVVLDFGAVNYHEHENRSCCLPLATSEYVLNEANGFVHNDSLTFKITFEVDDKMMELPILERPSSVIANEATVRHLFPRYFASEFTDFVLLPGDTAVPGVLYETVILPVRPLVNQAMLEAMDAVNRGERSSLDAGGEVSQEDFPMLPVRVPKSMTEFDQATLEKLPAKSVLAYVVSLLGGLLDIPEKASMEDLVVLCHVIHLYRWHNLPCQSLVITLRNAIYRQCRSAIHFPWLFYVAWVECNQDKLLLNLLARFMRSDRSGTVAVVDALAPYANLDMHLFLDLWSCITERRNIAHEPEVKDISVQQSLDEIILGLANDPEEESFFIYSSTEDSEPVRFIPEILYARWPKFRSLMNDSRSASLPFSREAILAICHVVLSNGKHKADLSYQDSLDVLENGYQFGLSLNTLSTSDCQELFRNFLCECFSKVFQCDNPLLVLAAAQRLNLGALHASTLEGILRDPRSVLMRPGNLDLALALPIDTQRTLFQKLLIDPNAGAVRGSRSLL